MRNILIYSIILFSVTNCSCLAQTEKKVEYEQSENKNDKVTKKPLNVFGTWKVVKPLGGNITAISDEEAERFIGKKVTVLEPNRSYFRYDSCNIPKYHFRQANAEEYIYLNYRTSPQTIGIKEKNIDLLEIYCSEDGLSIDEDYPIQDFIVFKDEYLIDSWDGYFFLLEKTE